MFTSTHYARCSFVVVTESKQRLKLNNDVLNTVRFILLLLLQILGSPTPMTENQKQGLKCVNIFNGNVP